jgi:hypothetical protein
MTFLPIVERELRVAARRPGTYWTRWYAALGMMLVWLLLLAANRRMPAAELSQLLFVSFGVLALGFCLLAGIFLTADCLSEEKREGTLGLLFLTDLRGYDVVLGKLIATSVHSVYGLMAIFPVLALPLMMGGVTVGEFWRVVLLLVATLFLSLSLGMAASAVAREAPQAMAGTFLGVLVLAAVPPTLRWLGNVLFGIWPSGAMVWSSPGCAFAAALDGPYRLGNGALDFWMSLGTVSLLGLGCLVRAAVWLPRAWQEKADSANGGGVGKPNGQGPASWVYQPARLPRSVDADPYLWLASRAKSPNVPVAILLGLLVLLWLGTLALSVTLKDGKEAFVVCLFTSYALHQVGKYLAAVEATRQLGEDRRSGALELLLVTPLREAQILSGQGRALERHSAGLKTFLLLVNFCMCLAVLLRPRHLSMTPREQVIFMELFLGGILLLFMDFRALQTAGMWLALRARKQHRAVLGTLARVMLVPWAGIFLPVFLPSVRTFNPSQIDLAVIFASWFMVGILNDLFFSAQARAGLGRGLRYWVAEGKAVGDREPFKALEPSIPIAINA